MSLHLFATVFGVIFLAELPDKTALAALVLASRHRALPVMLGASLALTVQSALAVGAGSLLSMLPERVVHFGSGIVFLGCAILMWIRKPEADDHKKRATQEGFWRALWTVFVIVFIAEWGDLTQVGTAGFSAKYQAEWLTIFLAATAALWAVTAIAVFIGHKAGRLLEPRLTQRIAGVVFAAIGVILIAGWM
jgi:Ca2+/H+ antiporter, TMEM165/GDT1 family